MSDARESSRRRRNPSSRACGTLIRTGPSVSPSARMLCSNVSTPSTRPREVTRLLIVTVEHKLREGGRLAFLDLVDLVRDEPVRLAMDARCGLRVGRLDEAEDLPLGLVDPV